MLLVPEEELQPLNEELLIMSDPRYLSFKSQSAETMKSQIFDSSKNEFSSYEIKINKIVKNLLEPRVIDHQIKNLVVLDFQKDHLIYEKLYQQFLDKYSWKLDETQRWAYLKSLNEDFYGWAIQKNTALPSFESFMDRKTGELNLELKSQFYSKESELNPFQDFFETDGCGNLVSRIISTVPIYYSQDKDIFDMSHNKVFVYEGEHVMDISGETIWNHDPFFQLYDISNGKILSTLNLVPEILYEISGNKILDLSGTKVYDIVNGTEIYDLNYIKVNDLNQQHIYNKYFNQILDLSGRSIYGVSGEYIFQVTTDSFQYAGSKNILDILKYVSMNNILFDKLVTSNDFDNSTLWIQYFIILVQKLYSQNMWITDYRKSFKYNTMEQKINDFITFMDELDRFYQKGYIDQQNFLYMLYLKYSVDELKLDSTIYVNKVLTDLELYKNNLYKAWSLDQNVSRQNFKSIQQTKISEMIPYLKTSLSDSDVNAYLNEKGLTGSYTSLNSLINFEVPYLLILENMKKINLENLHRLRNGFSMENKLKIYSMQDVFMDVIHLKDYTNFNLETYFDYLFMYSDLNRVHKYILILKGISFSNIKDDILTYLQENKNYLTGKTSILIDSKPYTSRNIEIKYTLEEDVIDLYLNYYSKNNVHQNILNDCSNNKFTFVDYLIYEQYFKNLSLDKTSLQDIISDPSFDSELNHLMEEFSSSILDGKYYSVMKNVISFEKNIITPNNNYYEYLLQNIIFNFQNEPRIGPSGESLGLSGELLMESYEQMADAIYDFKNKLKSLNINLVDFSNTLFQSNLISKTSKLIFRIIVPTGLFQLSSSQVFGDPIEKFLSSGRINQLIFNDIYQLYENNQINLFVLLLLLWTISFSTPVALPTLGKLSKTDNLVNFSIDKNQFISNYKLYIQSHQNLLSQILNQPSSDYWMKRMMMRDYTNSLSYYKTFEQSILFKNNENNKLKNKRYITNDNYINFVEEVIREKVSNPYQLSKMVDQTNMSDDTPNLIASTIKRNFGQIMNTEFYYDWALENIDASSGKFKQDVGKVFANLLEFGILTEKELFYILKEILDPDLSKSLTDSIEIENYIFKEDWRNFMLEETNPKKKNTNNSSKMENIYDLISSNTPTTNIPSPGFLKSLSSETPVVNIRKAKEEINKELHSLPKDDVLNPDVTPEEKEEKYYQNRDAQNMFKYIQEQAKARGQDLNEELKHFMNGMMALQIMISMFDPTQVLSDFIFEKILYGGILRDYLNYAKMAESKIKMDIRTYGSSVAAFHIYLNARALVYNDLDIDNKAQDLDKVNKFNELIKRKLETMTGDEKWNVEKSALICTRMWNRFINNNNEIMYSGNPGNIGIRSPIQKIDFEDPHMTANPGGNGLIKLEIN